MRTCLYYQAHIRRKDCWFFAAIFRSFEHLGFDRTLDKQTSLFEFFIPPLMQKTFEAFMDDMIARGVVLDIEKKPNRLMEEEK